MTNKMVLIITTTKFKVTVYLTFKEAFKAFYTFSLDFYCYFYCVDVSCTIIITEYKYYLHSVSINV